MAKAAARKDTQRLPATQRVARRLRWQWERVRPFPLPAYEPGTPRLGGSEPLDPFFPPTALTLGAAAMSLEVANDVFAILDKLTPGEDSEAGKAWHEWAQDKFGPHWRYADMLTALRGAATLIHPKTYLEIGVCRGRSAAVVGATCPECEIYGFDMWIPEYAGAPNPGPDFVRGELEAAGHTGKLVLESGDSHVTMPVFLERNPDLYFDLVTIDGDKSLVGVATDFSNALPRLKVGGIVITDDLPMFPILRRVWNKAIRQDSRYVSWDFTDAGFGVAAAIRVADTPVGPIFQT